MEAETMKTRSAAVALAGLLALGTTGCDDSVTGPVALDEEALMADVAVVAADGMFQDLAHMESVALWAGTGFGPQSVGIELEESRTFTRTITFYDAAGNEQEAHDPLTTASIHVESELTRTSTHTFWTADIHRERDMYITGLEGEETQRTWNGTGSSEVERSRFPDGGVEREYEMTGTALIEDVVRGVPRAEYPYPLSGTITRTMHVVITMDGVSEERDIVAVITFDGSQYATLTVNGEEFQVDLAERGLKGRLQRKNG